MKIDREGRHPEQEVDREPWCPNCSAVTEPNENGECVVCAHYVSYRRVP